MKLNAPSYFAGMATVVTALTIGFCGALLITAPNQPNAYQNRVQQVMSHAPTSSTAKVLNVDEPVQNEAILSQQPVAPINQPSPEPNLTMSKQAELPNTAKPGVPQPLVAQDTESVNRAKVREAEVKHAVERENQRKWDERKRKQREIESATIAVKRMLQDNRSREIVQVENKGPPRFGFFGND